MHYKRLSRYRVGTPQLVCKRVLVFVFLPVTLLLLAIFFAMIAHASAKCLFETLFLGT
jgi:hypothetical protein